MEAPPSQRLPRGRHGLSREEVARSQRERIFWAMAETMSRQGFEGTSVSEVARTAGVSRESFYAQFDSKQDCFMSAMEAAVEAFVAPALPRPDDGSAPLERIDRLVRRYLDALADRPALARMFLIEVYAAGPQAMERRARLQATYVEAVRQILGEEDPLVAEALVAAVVNLATSRLAVGDLEGLRGLHAPIVALAQRLANSTVR
jgi:AcrR family transcriptional regulator